MSSHLLQYILSFFNNEMTLKAAMQFREDNASVQKAIRAVVPFIMNGFASRARESEDKAVQLFVMANEAASGNKWQQTGNWSAYSDTLQKGMEILDDLYGHRNTERIAIQLAAEAGIKPLSAQGVMQWVAPLCAEALGKYCADNKLDAAGLTAFLGKEKVHFETNLQDALKDDSATVKYEALPRRTHTKAKLWIPALLLLLLAGVCWYCLRGSTHETEIIAPVTSDTAAGKP